MSAAPAWEHLTAKTQKETSLKKAFLAALLAGSLALLAASAAFAAPAPFQVSGKLTGNGTTVTYTVTVRPPSDAKMISVSLHNCWLGQQSPMRIKRTRHLDGFHEALTLDKAGDLVWYILPAGMGPKTLSIPFILPQGKGGPMFCEHASYLAWGSGERVEADIPVPLG